MMGKTHLVIGVSYGVALVPAVTRGEFTPTQLGFIMTGLVIGSLLPDIDHPQSLISQQIPLVGKVISRLTRHRGLFHSILGVVILFGLSAWLSILIAGGLTSLGIQQADTATRYISAGLMIGYILHIVADMLTISGVKLFYPWKRNIRIPLFKTGGFREWVLGLVLIVVSTMQIIALFID
jgi:inner membrane protein